MSISFSGLASGLDTSSWIKSLTALKQAKVTVLQEERETLVSAKDTLASIRSFFSSFRSTIEKITDSRFNIPTMDLFAQNLAVSANMNVLTATATHEAEEGKYEISVDKLATQTQAVSGNRYKTTRVETTTATLDTKLSTLGIGAGNILVTVPSDGLQRGMKIEENDTLQTLIDKFKEVGVEANYNEATGTFSMNIGSDDIDDIGHTGIVDVLHLTDVNEGYKTSKLQIENITTEFNPAEDDTLLSYFGVESGTIEIVHNDNTYNFTIDKNTTTFGDLLTFFEGKGIEASLSNGVLSFDNVEITNNGTTNFTTALGLSSEVAERSQVSNNLSYETTIVDVTVADEDTLLNDLTGVNITSANVQVTNSNGEVKTINLTSASTLGDLLGGMEDAGLSTTINPDGTIEITGGTITGGTFDAITALGLNDTPYTAFVTGNALTETVTVPEIVTLATEFVDDLNVTEGLIKVVDAEGETHYMEIYDGLSIGEFITDLGNLGLLGELDEDTGVLTITGGDFSSLTQSEINAADAAGELNGVSLRTATDILDLLFPDMGAATEVVQTFAMSRALSRNVTNTILAEADTTTLGSLGLTGNETATFDVLGSNVNVDVTTGMTINQFIAALDAKGISASFDEDTHRLTINNAKLTSTGTLADALQLTTTESNKYTASIATYADSTLTIYATEATTLEQLGIATNQEIKFYDETGQVGSLDATKDTTVGDILQKARDLGITAVIENGVIKLDGGYIENASVESVLGLETTTTDYSHVLGDYLTDTETVNVDFTTTLEDIIGIDDSDKTLIIKNRDGDEVASIDFTKTQTLGEVVTELQNNGITVALSDGVLSFSSASGNYITGDCTLAQALGIGVKDQAIITSTTYKTGNLLVNTTLTMNRDTTLENLGITDYALTITEPDGDPINKTFEATTKVGEILDWMSANGVSASVSDGVISLSSTTGAYVTGTLATAFGIGTVKVEETITVGIQQSSGSVISYGTSVQASLTTTISETLTDFASLNKTITVRNEEGQAVGTVTVDSNTTYKGLFDALDAYGVQGTMENGVVTLVSSVGNYVEGDVTSAMGILTDTTNVVTTIGVQQTGSAQSVHATSDTLLKDVLGDDFVWSEPNTLIAIYDSKQPVNPNIGVVTISSDMTIGDMLTAFAGYGITGKITDGVITLSCAGGNIYAEDAYADGNGALTKLGITTTEGVEVTEIIGNVVSGEAQTYSTTTVATTEALLTQLGKDIAVGDKLEIWDRVDGKVGEFVVAADSTIQDLMDALAAKGIASTFKDGVLTIENSVGFVKPYDDGDDTTNLDLSGKLGIGLTGQTITTTVGTDATATEEITYSYYTIASESTTFGDLGLIAEGENSIVRVLSDGYEAGFVYKSLGTANTTGLLSVGLAPSFESGQTYLISSTDEWNVFADMVNQGYNTKGATFVLGADLDFGGQEIECIDTVFEGILQGNYHVMSNFVIMNAPALFANAKDALFHNLGIENAHVNLGESASNGAGILVGHYVFTSINQSCTSSTTGVASATKFLNVYTTGEILAPNNEYTGGVVGYYEAQNSTQLSGGYAHALYITSSALVGGGVYAGGIFGGTSGFTLMGDIASLNRGIDAQGPTGAIVGQIDQSATGSISNWAYCYAMNNYDTGYMPDAVFYGERLGNRTVHLNLYTIGIDATLRESGLTTITASATTGVVANRVIYGNSNNFNYSNTVAYSNMLQLTTMKLYLATFTSESTLGDFIDKMTTYGINITLENGVLNVNNAVGADVTSSINGADVDNLRMTGDLIDALGMTRTDHAVEDWNEIISSTIAVTYTTTVKTTAGLALTSTAAITYTATVSGSSTGYYEVSSSSAVTYSSLVATAATADTTLGSLGIDTTDDTIIVTDGYWGNYNGFWNTPVTFAATGTALSSISSTSTITSGTYAISTTSELQKLATMTNNGYIQGGTFILTADLDLSGIDWTPIGRTASGTAEYNFYGKFYGQGHTISNMNVTGDYQYAGLFGANRGLIQDIMLINCTVDQTSTTATDTLGGIVCGYNLGSTAASSSIGTISNVAVVGGEVIGAQIGGFAGGNNGTIQNSWTSATVDVLTNNSWNTCGGFVSHTADKAYFYQCYALNDSVDNTGKYSAGLIGYFGSAGGTITVSNCYVADTGADYVFAARNSDLFTINCSVLSYASTISSPTLGDNISNATATVQRSATAIDGFSSSTKLSTLLDAIGFDYTIENGYINIWSEGTTNAEYYETQRDYIMGSIIDQLGLTRTYTTSPDTGRNIYVYKNSTALATNTLQTVSICSETTWGELGFDAQPIEIELKDLATGNIITTYSAGETESVYDSLLKAGCTPIIENGKLTILAPEGYSLYNISDDEGNGLDLLNIDLDDQGFINTGALSSIQSVSPVMFATQTYMPAATLTNRTYVGDTVTISDGSYMTRDTLMNGLNGVTINSTFLAIVKDGVKTYIAEFGTTSTVGDFCDVLEDHGFTTSLSNGVLTITSPANAYIEAPANFQETGKILSAVGLYDAIEAGFELQDTEVPISGSNGFSQIGLTSDGYFTLENTLTGATEIVTIAPSMAIAETGDQGLPVLQNDYTINISLTNGIVTMTANGDWVITGISDNIVEALNLDKDTMLATNTVKKVLTNETTFADLGFDISDGITHAISIIAVDDMSGHTYYVDDENESVYEYLLSTGCNVSIVDGKFVIEPPEGMKIGVSSELADLLNISSSGGTTITTTTTGATLNDATTLKNLGVSSSQTISVKNSATGAVTTHTIEVDDSIIDKINSISGLHASVSSGKIQITMDSGYCITDMSSDLVSALHIQEDTANIDSNFLDATVTGTGLKRSLGLDQLVSSGGSWTVWDAATDSQKAVIDYTTDMTVGDFLEALANAGVYSKIEDGVLTLVQGENYIKNEDDALWQKFYGSGSNSNEYEVEDELYDYQNDPSDTLNWTHTVTMDYDSTLAQLGVDDDGGINIHVEYEDGTCETVTVDYTTDMTVRELLDALEPYGIYGKIENGVLTFIPVGDNYIVDLSNNNSFESGLGINLTNASGTITWHKYDMDPSNELSADLTGSTTFAQLGVASTTLNDNGTPDDTSDDFYEPNMVVKVNSDGEEIDITVRAENTLSDFMAALAGAGISSEIKDGIFTIKGSNYAYITDMDDTLAGELGLTKTDSAYSTTLGVGATFNTNSNTLQDSIVVTMTSSTTFGNLGVADGTNMVVKVQNNDGKEISITMQSENTIGDFVAALAGAGISSEIVDGKLYIKASNSAYISAIDSTLANKLGLNATASNYQSTIADGTIINTNSTAHKTHNKDLAITADTLLTAIKDKGITTSDKATITRPDGTTQEITVGAGDTVSDFFSKIAQYGMTGTIDTDGKITIVGTGDTTISGTLIDKLGVTTTVNKDTITTNTSSNKLEHIVSVAMHDGTSLEELEIKDNGGKLKLYKDGVEHTITLQDGWTVADFRNKLSDYGITSEIIDGKLSLTSDGVVRFVDVDSDAVEKFGIEQANWSTIGEFHQESDPLSDIRVDNPPATMQAQLEKLTDADGNVLKDSSGNALTSGNIYVYQDGTRHTVYVDKSDTVETLASKLSPYGITVTMDQHGVISFAGDNNSYIADAGESNLIDVLKIGTWNTVYNSTSRNLQYTEDDTAVINGDTKMVDILGGNSAVTTGTYNVVSNGVTTVEEITDDTTVDDFIATLSTYGMTASINSDGQIAVGGQNNTYLKTSTYATGNSSVVSALFTEWDFVNVYESNNLEIPTPVIETITRDTRLDNINEGDDYVAGYITVVKDGVQTDIELTADETVGTLMDELALYGFECTINGSGQLIVKNTGNSELKAYTGANTASNALDILGIGSGWIKTNLYTGAAIDVIEETDETRAADRTTKLSDLEGLAEEITTGEYYIYSNGVRYTALISSDETVGSFLDTLAAFGIQANIVSTGTASVLQLQGNGDSYITTAPTGNSSNVATVLFPAAGGDTVYNYDSKQLNTSTLITTHTDATEDTLLKDLDIGWADANVNAQGQIAVNVDGNEAFIQLTNNETVGSLLGKFRALGLEASISNGEILISDGFSELEILTDPALTTSAIYSKANFAETTDLGGYCASNAEITWENVITEDVNESVAAWIDDDTVLDLLNISSGTLTVFRNGEKATINVDRWHTFSDLRSLVAGAFDEGDVTIKLENGYLEFCSTNPDVSVEVGATTDTSNIAAICGLANNKTGSVKSARELYQVNNSSQLTASGIFRLGNVSEGTFTIGDAEFEITNQTTLSSIIAQINSSEEANATAFWDSIDGKLVLKSRTTGSAFINIEAGTSNFTDIMGFTKTENAGTANQVTKINVEAQEVGDNASFSINGTHYTSTSNTITSDLSRITGVTINLKGVSEGGSTTLTIERDKETVANAVSDVVDAYNELIENVDKEVARGAELADQSTLKLIRNQIRSLMTSSLAGSGVFKNLDQVGIVADKATANSISTDRVNVLTFDKNKFLEAFDADRDALKDLIVGTDAKLGIFSQVENVLESSLAGVYGYFDSASKAYDSKISRLDDKITKAQKAVERYTARLEAKFSAMDLLIAKMQNQYSSFLG